MSSCTTEAACPPPPPLARLAARSWCASKLAWTWSCGKESRRGRGRGRDRGSAREGRLHLSPPGHLLPPLPTRCLSICLARASFSPTSVEAIMGMPSSPLYFFRSWNTC